jgi:hypothetical protein
VDAQFETLWRQSIEEEVNRRLAARELTVPVQQADMDQQQIHNTSDTRKLLSGVHR